MGVSMSVTLVPLPSTARAISMRASPNGRPRAVMTSRSFGTTSSTLVSSASTAGHTPLSWNRRLPTAGQAPSTARMWDVPTTHPG